MLDFHIAFPVAANVFKPCTQSRRRQPWQILVMILIAALNQIKLAQEIKFTLLTSSQEMFGINIKSINNCINLTVLINRKVALNISRWIKRNIIIKILGVNAGRKGSVTVIMFIIQFKGVCLFLT